MNWRISGVKKIKLFCLPYAGATSFIFSSLGSKVHNEIEVCPVELAGRGIRCDEPFCENFEEAVNDAYETIKDSLIDSPYAFFGHSMGSWLALELYHKILEKGHNKPIHIFFSGNKPPHIPFSQKKIHTLPQLQFKQELLKLGGTKEEVFDNEELAKIFIPILRADYKIIENYKYVEKANKIDCGVTIFNGTLDVFTEDEIKLWQKYCEYECRIINYEGGHFFINDKMEEIAECISDTIMSQMLL
jgi:medium-chain acyl-[acyl-carrier-protein] hydrolase